MEKLQFEWIKPDFLWLFFIIFAAINFFSSMRMVRYLAALKMRTKVSSVFLGAVVLSIITALPELISAISSGIIGNPEVSLGDVMGSDLFSGGMLAVADLIFIRYLFFQKINKSNRFIIYLMLIVNTILVMSLMPVASFNFMRVTIPYLNISWPLLGLVFWYLFFLIFFIRGFDDNDGEVKTHQDIKLKQYTLKKIFIFFITAVICLVLSSILLVIIINNFTHAYGIKKESAGAIFLGFTTGLPEVVGLFSLAKLGYGNMAIASIFGGFLFKSIIYFVADLSYFRNGLLEHLMQNQAQNLLPAFLLAGFLLTMTILFVLKTIKFFNKNKYYSITLSVGICLLYVANIVVQILLSYHVF